MNNNLEHVPVIMMHNIPCSGFEEQIICIYKKSSVATAEYSIDSCNNHIILGLDYDEDSTKSTTQCKTKNNEKDESEEKFNLLENNEINPDKSLKRAGVLCKIIRKYIDPEDEKKQIKILLSTHARMIITKLENTTFDEQNILVASLAENRSDNFEYVNLNIIKLTKKNCSFYQEYSSSQKPESQNLIETQMDILMSKLKHYCQNFSSVQVYNFIKNIDNYSKRIDKLSYELQPSKEELFLIITEFSLVGRINILGEMIDKATIKHTLNKTIDEKVRASVEKTQKCYLIAEKIKILNKELETLTGDFMDTELLEQQLNSLSLSEKITKKLKNEIKRLKVVNSNSSDSGIIRNYLDWCLNLPWNIYSPSKENFSDVYKDLNKEHYGMEKVKERILEYLAVDFKKGKTEKSALLLVGPPGVGKTSLSKKIAKSLGREFARISLGGIKDEAEIRGHRRTYLGSMPGKIIQSIRDLNTMNPVILLDEIDKIGHDFRGDPASALLEVLDREQNNDFVDHYLDIPFDLSSVLFICTANSLSPISRPVLDRVEIIQLASYSDDEKFSIGKDYMIPKQMKEHNLDYEEIIFSEDAIKIIISEYTYEAGVRGLGEQISLIMRKILLKIINEKLITPVTIEKENLSSFLGLPKYMREKNKKSMIGIIHGLAWNELGGDVLIIEAVAIPNETPNYCGSIKYTGKLGEVMQESIQTAFSYLKSCRNKILIEESFYKTHDIHVHVPEGGTPKDGPSAGITIFTSLVSLLLQKKIRADIAMTGEITLRGRVLAIGGLKEKILAAKRNGIKTIVLPKENERELSEIPKKLVENLKIILIESAIDVLPFALIDYKNPLEEDSNQETQVMSIE